MNAPGAPNEIRRIVALTLVTLLVSPPAATQVFSPGDLSSSHAGIDGLSACNRCHQGGGAVFNAGCLECHTEIGSRIRGRRGLHATFGTQNCGKCHQEHRGRSASLIVWPGGQRRFQHGRIGFPLEGQHGKTDCRACHRREYVVAQDIRKLVAGGKRKTFLGLDATCTSCHFDEHRDQLGQDCARCHGVSSFASAPLFNHERQARFARTGQHRGVACAKCHGQLRDERPRQRRSPAPRSDSYTRYRGLKFSGCIDCHANPHQPSRGLRCTSCHSTSGWKVVSGTSEAASFHDGTGFPLQGGHVGVACKACHGPFPDLPASEQGPTYAGTAHARCDDCHVDAHVGQLTWRPPTAGGEGSRTDCNACHDVAKFSPARFSADDHAGSRFALTGAHRAIACADCHLRDEFLRTKVDAPTEARLTGRGRPVLLSLVRFKLPDVTGDCETCHLDVHGGQFSDPTPPFAERSCSDCHQATTFADHKFEHQWSRFPLEGKHAPLACAACHQPAAAAEPATAQAGSAPETAESLLDVGSIRYRPLPMDCASCHADEHLGQFGERGACERCHQVGGFDAAAFDHNDPNQSRFAIDGKHGELDCNRCHPFVDVGAAKPVQKFAGLPIDCAGCHADHHRGRFNGFSP